MHRRNFLKGLAIAAGMTAYDGFAEVPKPGISVQAVELNLYDVFKREEHLLLPGVKTHYLADFLAANAHAVHLSVVASDGISVARLNGCPVDPITRQRIGLCTFQPAKLKIFSLNPAENAQVERTVKFTRLDDLALAIDPASITLAYGALLDESAAENMRGDDYHPISLTLGLSPINSNAAGMLMLRKLEPWLKAPVTQLTLEQYYSGYNMFGINHDLRPGLDIGNFYSDMAKHGASVADMTASFATNNCLAPMSHQAPIVRAPPPIANRGAETQEYGKTLWASEKDIVEPQRDFARTTLGADAVYHMDRKSLSDELLTLDRDVKRAAPPAQGPAFCAARDYVAGQAAIGIENAIRIFEADTGLKCGMGSPMIFPSRPGLSRLEAAISHAQDMASNEFVERNFAIPLYKDGQPFWKFAKAFNLATANIVHVVNKISAVQKTAHWVASPGIAELMPDLMRNAVPRFDSLTV